MARLKPYLSDPITTCCLVLLAVSLVLAQRSFATSQTWFRLLSSTGLDEVRARAIHFDQSGNVTSISYQYQVTDSTGAVSNYTNVMSIQDISLEVGNLGERIQNDALIEYVPDAPAYSTISKQLWLQLYQEQFENSIVNKWWNELGTPALFAGISLTSLIFIITRFRRIARKPTPNSA